MITVAQLFGNKPHSPEQEAAGARLLEKVNSLLAESTWRGVPTEIDTERGDQISGRLNGNGGFRLPDCTEGAAHSSHKILEPEKGAAVDVYDPHELLDAWITDAILEKYGLYREHPDSTHGWCHLTDKPPGSGHRTFYP